MNLKHINDSILLTDIKYLVLRERELTTKILHHLKEIDRRKLYCDLKYSSLFDYCVRELGYSESSAQRRIVAARMLAEIPEIEEKIETGALTLSNIAKVNQFFRQAKTEEKKSALQSVERLNKKECEKKLFEITGKDIPVKETQERVGVDKVKVAIVLSDETLQAIEEVKNLIGKELSHDELILYMAKAATQKIEKEKFKQKPERTVVEKTKPLNRVPTAHVKREVFARDKACVKCGSRHRLNYDHKQPYALGGKTDKTNIRLLCFQCNQRERIKLFGQMRL